LRNPARKPGLAAPKAHADNCDVLQLRRGCAFDLTGVCIIMVGDPRIAARWGALRSRWWIAAALIVLAVPASIFAVHAYQVRAERREAFRQLERDGFSGAEPFLLSFYERHPQDVEIVRTLALGYIDARSLAGTERFLNRWCELETHNPEPYRQRFQFLNMQQKVPGCIQDLEHILELTPGDVETRRTLAQLLALDGRYEQAELEGLRCYRAQPKDVDLWFLLATIYRGLHQSGKAADLLDQVLLKQPGHANALKLRAQLHLDAGKPEPAIALLKQLVDNPSTRPDSTEGMYELSMALTRAGRPDEANRTLAEMDYRLAQRLWSEYEHRDDNVGLQERLVEAMLALGKLNEAVQFLNNILKRNPAAPGGTHRLLAKCYEKQGQPLRAAEERRRAEMRQSNKETIKEGHEGAK
jgi:predicted Zn-dependent protease